MADSRRNVSLLCSRKPRSKGNPEGASRAVLQDQNLPGMASPTRVTGTVSGTASKRQTIEAHYSVTRDYKDTCDPRAGVVERPEDQGLKGNFNYIASLRSA